MAVSSDYVYRGARVHWTASVTAIQEYGMLGADWNALTAQFRSLLEGHGFANVSVTYSNWWGTSIEVDAFTPIDFLHLPDVRSIFDGCAYQAGILISNVSDIVVTAQGQIPQGGGAPSDITPNPVTQWQYQQPGSNSNSNNSNNSNAPVISNSNIFLLGAAALGLLLLLQRR